MKMLGPWPVLQFIFGIAVLGGGVWAIIRGTQKKDEAKGAVQLEDKRAEWEMLQIQRQMLEETRAQSDILRTIQSQIHSNAEAMRALSAAVWNEGRWPRG